MDDAFFVGGGEGVGKSAGDVDDLVDGKGRPQR
jgi:hypothetical protein